MPHGGDVAQIRLAGAAERAAECVRRLLDYVAGRADTIPELDDLARVDFKPDFGWPRGWARVAHATVIA